MTPKNFWLKSKSKGFTLIELLVVIAIIGILATVSVIGLSTVRAKSRDVKRVADVKQLQTAMELFFNDMNRYPTENEFASGSLFSTSTGQSAVYMAQIPVAPTPADGNCTSGDNSYNYLVSPDYSNYRVDFCIGGKVGAVTGGLQAGTPAGFAQLSQGVFIDEAMSGLKAIAMSTNRSTPMSSDIIYTTTDLGRFKYLAEGSTKIAFFADDQYKIKLGEINHQNIATDLVVTLPEITSSIREQFGTDYKKMREAGANDATVLNMARFIAAISDKNSTFSLGREMNDANVLKTRDYMAKNKIEVINQTNVSAVLASMEKDAALTFATADDVKKSLATAAKDVNNGVYDPTKINIEKLEATFTALTPEQIKKAAEIQACKDKCTKDHTPDDKKIAECQAMNCK